MKAIVLIAIVALLAPVYGQGEVDTKKQDKRGILGGYGYGGFGHGGLGHGIGLGYGGYGHGGFIGSSGHYLGHGIASPSYSHAYSAPIAVSHGYSAPLYSGSLGHGSLGYGGHGGFGGLGGFGGYRGYGHGHGFGGLHHGY